MTDVLIAVALAVGGLILGSIAAPLTRKAMASRSQPAIRESAKSAGSFVFGLFCALGLVAALGVASPESLRPLPGDIARFLPRAMVAGLLIIGGRIVATVVVTTVGRAMLKATGRQQNGILRTIEMVIVALVTLVAAGQLGIDTTVLNILVAAIAFGAALAMALLIGVGGRETSREIAAGRSLSKYLSVGDGVDVAGVRGIVTELRATVLILSTDDGEVVLNNTMAQSTPMRLSRIERSDTGD